MITEYFIINPFILKSFTSNVSDQMSPTDEILSIDIA